MLNLQIPAAIDFFSAENLAGYTATAIVAVLGFLITWFFLKKLLYKPMMKISEARQAVLESGLEKNAAEEERIQALKASVINEKEDWEKRRDELMQEARVQANEEGLKLLETARAEAARIVGEARARVGRMDEAGLCKQRTEITCMAVDLLGAYLQEEGSSLNTVDKEAELEHMVQMMLEARSE